MHSRELNLPEGKVFLGDLVCADPRNPVSRQNVKLRAVASLLVSAGIEAGPPGRLLIDPDRFGKPELSTPSGQPAAVSFSWQADRLWTALSSQFHSIGVDAAVSADFDAGYPFAKVFNEREWNGICARRNSSVPHGASLLWSAKEAAVKMLGRGFDLVEPLRISVMFPESRGPLLHSHVCVSSRTGTRKVNVFSIEHGWGWISLALGDSNCRRIYRAQDRGVP